MAGDMYHIYALRKRVEGPGDDATRDVVHRRSVDSVDYLAVSTGSST